MITTKTNHDRHNALCHGCERLYETTDITVISIGERPKEIKEIRFCDACLGELGAKTVKAYTQRMKGEQLNIRDGHEKAKS